MAVLPNLQQQLADAQAQIAAMQTKLDAKNRLSLKVTAKKEDGTGTDGALSIYGLGRFPITLYRGQWERLIGFVPEIETFIAANADRLAVKA
jgi:hypothetical protein